MPTRPRPPAEGAGYETVSDVRRKDLWGKRGGGCEKSGLQPSLSAMLQKSLMQVEEEVALFPGSVLKNPAFLIREPGNEAK